MTAKKTTTPAKKLVVLNNWNEDYTILDSPDEVADYVADALDGLLPEQYADEVHHLQVFELGREAHISIDLDPKIEVNFR